MLFPWQVTLTLVAGCVTLVLAFVALSQRKLLVATPFAACCVLASLWCFLYCWQMQAESLEGKLFPIQLGFSVIAFLPLLAFEVTYRFVYERPFFRGWLLVGGLIIPVITAALAWTLNEYPIFRYDFWIDTGGAIPVLRFKMGPWNLVFYGYTFGLAIWSFTILLRGLNAVPPWVRRARILLVVARVFPMVFEVIYHLDILPPSGMSYAPASIAISDIILTFLFFGDRIGYHAYIAHSTLVEKISDMLVVFDRQHRVLDMNRAATVALGQSLKTAQGQPVEKLFETWKEVSDHLQGGQSGSGEFERNGKCFELTILPVEEGDKHELSMLWLRDITRRKQAERSYLAANEAKERYLAVMSHEIRGPLNSVLGFMRLLETTPLDKDQREYIEHVGRSGDNLLSVINEVLDFSKMEAGHMQLDNGSFDFAEEIRNLCSTMQLEADAKGLSFEYRIAEGLPHRLIGDKLRIGQVLRNLISNAIKFTSEGSVVIEVDCLEKTTGPKPDCQFRVNVTDTGIGISSDEMTTLFQPFSQATRSIQHKYGGTGLGLVIAKRFCDLMGGDITVESTPGQGSTFSCRLHLPVDDSMASSESRIRVHDAIPSLRLLVVDDQPVNCRLLEIMLRKMNHETTTATDGAECVALLQKSAFDVVIMDIEMPGVDGFEAARQIHIGSQGNPPYIIALTAHASLDIREQCIAAGMNDYLSKPVTLLALKNALEMAFERKGIE